MRRIGAAACIPCMSERDSERSLALWVKLESSDLWYAVVYCLVERIVVVVIEEIRLGSCLEEMVAREARLVAWA